MLNKICKKCGASFTPAPDDEQAELCYKCKNKYSNKSEKFCYICGKQILNVRSNSQRYCDDCKSKKKRTSEKYICACCGRESFAIRFDKAVQSGTLYVCDPCRENNKQMQISFKKAEDLQNYRKLRQDMIKRDPPILNDQFFLDGLKHLKEKGIIK